MKHITLLAIVSLFISATAGCQPRSFAQPNSGIEIKLTGTGAELRPDGLLHIEGLDNRVSIHAPLAPSEPGAATQRLELPPGSYTVTYLPVEVGRTLRSMRDRAPAKIVSQNPFVVEVSRNEFKTVRVRTTEDGASDAVEPARGYATATR
jgi:hypothetical protein